MDKLTEARAVLAPKQRVRSDTLMTDSLTLKPPIVALGIISICFFAQASGDVKIVKYPTDRLQLYPDFLPYSKKSGDLRRSLVHSVSDSTAGAECGNEAIAEAQT